MINNNPVTNGTHERKVTTTKKRGEGGKVQKEEDKMAAEKEATYAYYVGRDTEIEDIMDLQRRMADEIMDYEDPDEPDEEVTITNGKCSTMYVIKRPSQLMRVHQHAIDRQSVRPGKGTKAFGFAENILPMIKFLTILHMATEEKQAKIKGKEGDPIVTMGEGFITMECHYRDLNKAVQMCHQTLRPLQTMVTGVINKFDFSDFNDIIKCTTLPNLQARIWAHQVLQHIIAALTGRSAHLKNERVVAKRLLFHEFLAVRQLGKYMLTFPQKFYETSNWTPFGGSDKYIMRGSVVNRVNLRIGTDHEIEGVVKYYPQDLVLLHRTYTEYTRSREFLAEFKTKENDIPTDNDLFKTTLQELMGDDMITDSQHDKNGKQYKILKFKDTDENDTVQEKRRKVDFSENMVEEGTTMEDQTSTHEEDSYVNIIRWMTESIITNVITNTIARFIGTVTGVKAPEHTYFESDMTDETLQTPERFSTRIIRHKNAEIALLTVPVHKLSLLEKIIKEGTLFEWMVGLNDTKKKEEFPHCFLQLENIDPTLITATPVATVDHPNIRKIKPIEIRCRIGQFEYHAQERLYKFTDAFAITTQTKRQFNNDNIMTLQTAIQHIYAKIANPYHHHYDDTRSRYPGGEKTQETVNQVKIFLDTNKHPTLNEVEKLAWVHASTIFINGPNMEFDPDKRKITITAMEYIDFHRQLALKSLKTKGRSVGEDKAKDPIFTEGIKCAHCKRRPQTIRIEKDPTIPLVTSCDTCGLTTSIQALEDIKDMETQEIWC